MLALQDDLRIWALHNPRVFASGVSGVSVNHPSYVPQPHDLVFSS
ncbi:hypothetical protein [Nostoc linckia]|nr:hypothetical protein [Nostoc linckia]